MSWITYLPPAFSIYLTLTSGAASEYVTSSIKKWIDRGEEDEKGNKTPSSLAGHEELVANVARDWNARYGFVSAMITSIISVLVICSQPVNYPAAVIGVLILVAIFTPMLWMIFTLDPDELTTRADWLWKWTPARWCKIILTGVNILLLALISAKQGHLDLPHWLTPPSISP